MNRDAAGAVVELLGAGGGPRQLPFERRGRELPWRDAHERGARLRFQPGSARTAVEDSG